VASDVTLPRLGQGMESGTITRWLKSEGDKVEKGEPLYELDTEKVTQEVEAEASGVLLKILVAEGEVEVGKRVAVIGEAGETVADGASGNGAAPKADKVPGTDEEDSTPDRVQPDEGGAEIGVEKPAEGPERDDERRRGREASEEDQPTQQAAATPRADGGRVKASPLARRLAKERGIELSSLRGTGPEGRVVAEDVERAAAGGPPSAPAPTPQPLVTGEVEAVKLTQMRRAIARRMTEAWQTPHFQIAMSADMRAATRVREALVARMGEGDAKPTVSDLLTKACAVALMRHRDMNAHFAGDEVRLFPTANIGIAVAVPRGLLVPVMQSCERRSIQELANARADLVTRTRDGKIQQSDLDGGTFTISNLGMYGVERFVAVLNPPQAGILAVGAIQERAVVEDGELVVRPLMEMTLSCDHRSVDGATASEFLRSVKELLEEPGLMA
jgi:pyruvate dehydrogenase E2 component (dihydrolipoamide acetyltransferase)